MICDAFNEVVQSKSQAVGTLPRTVVATFVTKGPLSSSIEATTATVLTFLLANVKGKQAFFLRFSFDLSKHHLTLVVVFTEIVITTTSAKET